MSKHVRVALVVSLAAALSVGLGACSRTGPGGESGNGGSDMDAPGVVGGTPKWGGTLTVLSNQDFGHLDPARNWVMPTMDFGVRLLYRTLTTFKAAPGREGTEIVPDLATDLGMSSEGGKVWTFTLKEGLRYEDGSPIKAQDVKYNVERSFAPALTGGPDYAAQYLDETEGYRGPLKGDQLSSIETPDDRTIVFRLKRRVAEFSSTVTLPTFSPVPASREKAAAYDLRPFSSGPYKIQSYARGKQMVLVRNKYWDPQSDTVRKAYPDKIVVKPNLESSRVDDRLIDGSGADASAVQWSDIRPESVPRVLTSTEAKSRLVGELSGCTEMLHLNTSRAPFNDPAVRQAVHYAVDKESQVTANGGLTLNEVATAYLPPALAGGKKVNELRIPTIGDPEKAKRLLAEAGKSKGFSATITVSAGDRARADAIKDNLAQIGIKVIVRTAPAAVYYDEIGNIKKAPDMSLSGWCPDYPSGATFLPFVFDGRRIKDVGNQGNVSQFRDDAVIERMDEIAAMTDPDEANRAWIDLDKQILAKAPSIPLLWERKGLLVGKNVAGAFGHPVWAGQFDYAVIGLKDPAQSTG